MNLCNPNTIFGGYVSITLPYTLQVGEQDGGLRMAYVGQDGKLNPLSASGYNADAKALVGRTNHFTVFGIVDKPAAVFTDIANHWAKADIAFVADRGLLTGTGKTTFDPDVSMTRGMFVTALGRLAGIDPADYTSGKFTDVTADAYYAPYVDWAAAQNLVTGYGNGLFGPNDPANRQQLVTMLYRYAQNTGMDVSVGESANILSYDDAFDVAEWAIPAFQWACGAGVVSGTDDTILPPWVGATRAQIAAILHRYVELIIDPATSWGRM